MSNMSTTKTLTKADKVRLGKAEAKRARRRERNLRLAGAVTAPRVIVTDKMTVAELYALAKDLPGVTTKTRKADLLAKLGAK